MLGDLLPLRVISIIRCWQAGWLAASAYLCHCIENMHHHHTCTCTGGEGSLHCLHTQSHTRSTVLMSLECVLIDCTLLCGVTHENRYTVIVDLPQDLLARKSACVRTYLPNNGLHMVLLHLSPMADRCDRPVAQDRQPRTAVIAVLIQMK